MVDFKNCRKKCGINKRGQVSIFIIIAIVVVAVIVLFFAFRGRFSLTSIPAEFVPIYNLYSQCIEQEARSGAEVLGLQGGRISDENYVPASEYAPFSSHLNFFGSSVGYWYYLAGNGVIRENVPTKGDMERELANFIKTGVGDCNFKGFYEQGFYIDLGNPEVGVSIEDTRIKVVVNSNIIVTKDGKSARKTEHNVEVGSNLGKLYNEALQVYNKESKDAFLEEYGVDVLRLYAPVDGVEIQCSPKVWKTQEVVEELKDGFVANLGAIKFKGSYYSLNDNTDDYFVVDEKVNEPVKFMYVKDWPSKIEIYGSGVDQSLMIAEPVGNQEGLGVMGFCYTPYHYVYDVAFPVMVQVGDGLEIFQFPINVILDNNVPREANLLSVSYRESEFDMCNFKEGHAEIYTYDNNLNPVEASISFKCLDQICSLGETAISGDNAILSADIPQCVNGYVIARAEGFAEGKTLFSSNTEGIADIILDREYEIDVNVNVDGQAVERAIVYFVSDDGTKTAMIPDNSKITLKEGIYQVKAYVYGTTGLVIPASKRTQCVDVSRGGLLGLFGSTTEKCFDIDLPETKIEQALRGGGASETYILESELQSGKVTINTESLPSPNSLADLQTNYELFDTQGVEIEFG